MSCCKEKSQKPKKGFKPNYHQKALTEKFYSKHEQLSPHPNYIESYKRYASEIHRRQSSHIQKFDLAPRTENQIYGWLHYLVERYEPGYETLLFHRGRTTSEEIKIQLQINLATLRGLKR